MLSNRARRVRANERGDRFDEGWRETLDKLKTHGLAQAYKTDSTVLMVLGDSVVYHYLIPGRYLGLTCSNCCNEVMVNGLILFNWTCGGSGCVWDGVIYCIQLHVGLPAAPGPT